MPRLQQITGTLKTGTNQGRQQQGGADSRNTPYGRGHKGGGRGNLKNKGTHGGTKSRNNKHKVVGGNELEAEADANSEKLNNSNTGISSSKQQ